MKWKHLIEEKLTEKVSNTVICSFKDKEELI